MPTKAPPCSTSAVMEENSPEGERLLLDALFGGGPAAAPAAPVAVGAHRPFETTNTPQYCKVSSVSLYKEDIERLEAMVRELKSRGHYEATTSEIIHYALSHIDLSKFPHEL